MMLIRPPVVREMRQDLWAKMTKKPLQLAPEPAADDPVAEADRRLAQLKELGELRASGVLTDEEFEREKARVLA
jgi:Short C-terminal domain